MKIVLIVLVCFSFINAYNVMTFEDYKSVTSIKTELETTTAKKTQLKKEVLELRTFKQSNVLINIINDIEIKIKVLNKKETLLSNKLRKKYKIVAFSK